MPREDLTGRTIASYRLLEQIGEGGTATVYRAEHQKIGECAVKVLRQRSRSDPTAVKRFLREAGYGSRVEHDAVVRTYDFGEVDGLFYLALEWVTGQPLTEFAAASLDPQTVAHIVSQLAGGLAAAHAVGIIHRDLKPENIIYDPETKQAKLLDFGIARDSQEDPAERLTRTGFFVGSLNYVAPEALSGELVEESADIYSLATIAYYVLSGQHPHGGRSPREVFQQLLTQPPTPLRVTARGARVSRNVEAVIMKSLARNPKERHPDVLAFATELSAAAASPDQEPESQTGETEPRPGVFGSLRSLFGRKQ